MIRNGEFLAVRLCIHWRLAACLALCLAGCGRIVSQKATDQLIAGDAVDRSIAQIDFRILTGKKIFLDTQFVNKTVPGVGFVTSDYIVSSIRQKMMCDGCLLQEKIDEADFIVEMRIGALGADGHEIIYGMPPNNYVGLAASVASTSPQAAAILPSMPELSVAKKADQMAAAKIALFAYNRHTREPIWQSGISESRSIVADRWFMGAGPFHKGSIYNGKKNEQLEAPLFSSDEADSAKPDYFVERRFADPTKSLAETPVAAAKPAVAPPAANPPAVAAAPAAKPAAAVPTTAAPAPAPAVAAPVAAAPAVAAPVAAAPAVAAPVAAAPAVAAPVAAAPAVAAPVATAAPPAAAPPAATQTVNAAPPAMAAPPISPAPVVSPAPAAASAPPAANSATGSASVPTNAPKTVPSVNAVPSGQPFNTPANPLNLIPVGSLPDMLSVSLP